MRTVHLYEDNYVSGLEWQNRSLWVLLGFLCGLTLFGAWKGSAYAQSLNDSLRAAEEVIEGLRGENVEYKDALKDYTTKRGKVAAFIRKINPKLSQKQAEYIAATQMKHAREHNLPLEVVVALPWQESGYDPKAVSYTGCCLGLYQLNWKVHKDDYGLTSRNKTFDIETNIQVGLQMLADHHRRYGTYERALGRYYGSSNPDENVQYTRQVLAKSRHVLKQIG